MGDAISSKFVWSAHKQREWCFGKLDFRRLPHATSLNQTAAWYNYGSSNSDHADQQSTYVTRYSAPSHILFIELVSQFSLSGLESRRSSKLYFVLETRSRWCLQSTSDDSRTGCHFGTDRHQDSSFHYRRVHRKIDLLIRFSSGISGSCGLTKWADISSLRTICCLLTHIMYSIRWN